MSASVTLSEKVEKRFPNFPEGPRAILTALFTERYLLEKEYHKDTRDPKRWVKFDTALNRNGEDVERTAKNMMYGPLHSFIYWCLENPDEVPDY